MKVKEKFLVLQRGFLLIAFCLLPLGNRAFADDDTRTAVSAVEATSNIDQIPAYGASIDQPTMTVTVGAPAYFNIDSGNGWWHKKVGNNWVTVRGGSFTSGTWKFHCQIRIDGEAGKTHRLQAPITVKVNGVDWDGDDSPYVGSTYSYGWTSSPEYTIPEPEELSFVNWLAFNIGDNWVANEITSFSVADNAEGGTKPYVFSKTSGPEWINVSEDGTVSGTPTTVGNNDNLVVRVTDAAGAFREISITVAPTAADPAQRINVSVVEATSDIEQLLVCGQSIKKPTMTVTVGLPVRFAIDSSNGWWSKKGPNEWTEVRRGEFTPGTWKFQCQIRIDGEAGKPHKPQTPITVKVNGIDWELSNTPYIDKTYSYEWVESPEFEITEDTGIHDHADADADFDINRSYAPNGQRISNGYKGIVISDGKKKLKR